MEAFAPPAHNSHRWKIAAPCEKSTCSNKCIATSNKCHTSSNKKLLGTSKLYSKCVRTKHAACYSPPPACGEMIDANGELIMHMAGS